jgi:soluble lytic murein transglycosylase-like protein
MKRLLTFSAGLLVSMSSWAGSQVYEDISVTNRQELRQKLNSGGSVSSFRDSFHAVNWISRQSYQLRRRIPDDKQRSDLLRMVHYEAVRYQLDPDLVLSLIEVESGFNRFALSHMGASGLMQVMPFWKDLIGSPQDSLFEVHTNLRYGCIILRHYLDIENNNLTRGLARYNGSLGSEVYPSMVLSIWQSKFRIAEN